MVEYNPISEPNGPTCGNSLKKRPRKKCCSARCVEVKWLATALTHTHAHALLHTHTARKNIPLISDIKMMKRQQAKCVLK